MNDYKELSYSRCEGHKLLRRTARVMKKECGTVRSENWPLWFYFLPPKHEMWREICHPLITQI